MRSYIKKSSQQTNRRLQRLEVGGHAYDSKIIVTIMNTLQRKITSDLVEIKAALSIRQSSVDKSS